MGVPIIQEIFDGIKWSVDFFMSKTPRPIQIVLFLLMLLLFGNILSWVLHLGGIHCDSAKEPHKVDTIDVVANMKIFWWTASGTLNTPTATIDDVHPWTDVIYLAETIETCTWILKQDGSDYVRCENLTDPNCNYYYKNADCYNCTALDIGWVYSPQTILNWNYVGEVCGGDARPLTDQNWVQRNIGCEPLCEIPLNYAWDFDEGNFYCTDLDVCGANATVEAQPRVDEELSKVGAEPLYLTGSGDDIDRMLLIQCSDSYNPRLTLYGIDIFSYQLWVILLVVYLMFTFLARIRKH